jgi:hypothetical protein
MNRPFIPKPFEPRRTANWNIQLGFYHGQGLSSKEVAAKLGDGTGPATVRTMIQGAGLPSLGFRRVAVPIQMDCWQRDMAQLNAIAHGLSLQDYLRHIIESGAVFEDLYDAVTDGRYS